MSNVDSITYLVAIDPEGVVGVTTYEYIRLLDQDGDEWFMWFDADGGVTTSMTVPPIESTTPVEVTQVGPIPSWLRANNGMGDYFLYPDRDLGTIVSDTVPPGPGVEWDVGTSLTLTAQKLLVDPSPQEAYAIFPPDTPGHPWMTDRQPFPPPPLPADPFAFSAGARFPVYDGILWRSHLQTALNIETGYSPQQGIVGGQSTPRFGSMDIDISDESLDQLTAEAFDGRTVRVYRGRADSAFAGFTQILTATVQGVQWTPKLLTLSLADLGDRLKQDIQENLFLGSGLLDGDPDLRGQPIPITYGAPKNFRPRLVERANLIYKYGDGPGQLDGVFDQAVEYINDGDISTLGLATLFLWVPVPGHYITDDSRSEFRLGAEAIGPLTVDARNTAVPNNAALIIQDILQNRLNTPVPINAASIAQYQADFTAEVGIYIDAKRRLEDVITELAIGAVWGFNTGGEFFVRQIGFRAPVARVTDLNLIEFEEYSRDISPIPPWRLSLGYGKLGLKQEEEDIAAGADPSRKIFVGIEERFEPSDDAPTRLRHLLAPNISRSSLILFQVAAQTEVSRQHAVLIQAEHLYQLPIRHPVFSVAIGDTVTVQLARFVSRPMIVTNRVDRATLQGEKIDEVVTLTLWG